MFLCSSECDAPLLTTYPNVLYSTSRNRLKRPIKLSNKSISCSTVIGYRKYSKLFGLYCHCRSFLYISNSHCNNCRDPVWKVKEDDDNFWSCYSRLSDMVGKATKNNKKVKHIAQNVICGRFFYFSNRISIIINKSKYQMHKISERNGEVNKDQINYIENFPLLWIKLEWGSLWLWFSFMNIGVSVD